MQLLSKNLVLIHSNYHPDNHGGIEYVVKMLLEIVVENSIDTLCFFGGTLNTQECFYKPRIAIVGRRVVAKIAGVSFLSFGNLRFLYACLKSRVVIFQEPYPTLWPAMFVIRYLLRTPTILLVHANPVASTPVMKAYSFFRGVIFRGAVCVATSPNLLSQVRSKNYIANQVIPLCLSDRSFSYSNSLNLPERYVLYIGRLARYKGLEYLVEAATMQPGINFVIAGNGPLSYSIANAIDAKALKNIIFFNRFISEPEKNELIERSEFVVFPSTSANEAFGLVQLEAMRAGKALINTWIDTGVNYVAPNGVCAITVEKCNSIALSKAIEYLWNDIELMAKLGSSGLARYEDLFTHTQFLDAWTMLVKSMIKKVR
jgi:rhamnosyl/mannosyltransferase